MVKRIVTMLFAAMPMLAALGYTITTSRQLYYFESEGESDYRNGYRSLSSDKWFEWSSISTPSFSEKGDRYSWGANILADHMVVKDWGLIQKSNAPKYPYFDFDKVEWLGVSSTDYTHEYDSSRKDSYLTLWLRWYRFNLSFNSNGGSEVDAISDIPYKVSTGIKENGYLTYTENTVSLPTPTRTGYTFNGWQRSGKAALLKGSVKSSDIGVNSDGENITLTAQWTANRYTVTFNANGGNVSPPSQMVTYNSTYGTLPEPTRAGYQFNGWYTAASGGTKVEADTKVTAINNHSIYARWTANKYEIGYDNLFLMYSWGNSKSTEVSKNGSLGRVSYDLGGGTITVSSGDGSYARTTGGESSEYFTMPVSPNTRYFVSCDLGGMSSPNVSGKESAVLAWLALDSNRKVIPGTNGTSSWWWRGLLYSYGTAKKNAAAEFTTPDGCAYVQLYFEARNAGNYETWSNIRLSKFDPCKEITYGATRKVVTYSENGTYGDLETPDRKGYRFVGWKTVAGQEISPGTKIAASSVSVHSQWTPDTYTVTFNANGGSVTTANKSVTYDSTYGDLPVPTRTGYTFNGWYTAASGGTGVAADTKVTVADNHALYAQWTAEMRTAVFYDSDQTTVFLTTNVAYGTVINTPTSVTMHPGDVFKWWYDGNATYQPGSDLTVTENKSYYPVIEKMQTTITASVNPSDAGLIVYVGGHVDETGDAGRIVTVAVEQKSPAYYFSGWSDGVMTLTNTVEVITNMHLTANFTMKTNTVEFLGWNGEPIGAQSVPYGGSATNLVPPVYTGLTFVAWTPDSFTNNVTADMTVQALYETNRYTVVYNANGVNGESMPNDTIMYFSEYHIRSNEFTSALHVFHGWSTNPNAATNEVEYEEGVTVSNLTHEANGLVNLYAVWSSTLTPYSIAADCTNLVLECAREDRKWSIDPDYGFASTSSVVAAGDRICDMTTLIEGTGTLMFRVKILTASADNKEFNFYVVGDGYTNTVPEITALYYNKELDGDWILCVFSKTEPAQQKFMWNFVGKSDGDKVYVDQVRWYPNRLVSVDTSGSSWIASGHEVNGITESVLSHWDEILPSGITEAQIDATKSDGTETSNSSVTNALAILNLGYAPEYTVNGATAKLTFVDAPVLSVSAFEVEDSTDALLGASVTNTLWGLPDWSDGIDQTLGVWGAPTLTSDWSRVEAGCDLSRYVSEGVALFDFDVGTNRFFKVKAE